MSVTADTIWGLILTAIVGGCIAYVKKQGGRVRAVNDGIRCILYVEIKKAYYTWKDVEWCPLYILEDVEEMYKQYSVLGGNGAIKSIVEEMRCMPHIKKGVT